MTEPDSNRPDGGRDPKTGFFQPGNKFGKGRPDLMRLAEHQRAVREAVTAQDLRDVLQQLRVQALAGDVRAAQLLLDRVVGRPREEPTFAPIELPEQMDTLEECAGASLLVIRAIAAGDVDETAGALLLRLFEQRLHALELSEVSRRLTALERDKRP